MPRIPSKGLPLYACLCTSVALAAVSFWLNPPQATNLRHNNIQSPNSPSAAPLPDPVRSEAGASRLQKLSSFLHSSEPGDAETLRALENLATDPADTLLTGPQLLRDFPARADELGTILLGTLVRNSHHTAALELARHGPEASRAEWLQLILSHWARTEPDAGVTIVDQLRQNAVNRDTFERVAKNWASSAPDELARYALALPPGEYRSIALSSALEPWLLRDPAALAACLPQLNEPAERDSALAALAARTDTDFRPTSQAIAWADAIASTELRRDTLTSIIRDWFDRDPAAASRCLLQHPAFNTDQRQSLLVSLTPLPEAL